MGPPRALPAAQGSSRLQGGRIMAILSRVQRTRALAVHLDSHPPRGRSSVCHVQQGGKATPVTRNAMPVRWANSRVSAAVHVTYAQKESSRTRRSKTCAPRSKPATKRLPLPTGSVSVSRPALPGRSRWARTCVIHARTAALRTCLARVRAPPSSLATKRHWTVADFVSVRRPAFPGRSLSAPTPVTRVQ